MRVQVIPKVDTLHIKSLIVWKPGLGTRNPGTEVAVASASQEVMGPAVLQHRATWQ